MNEKLKKLARKIEGLVDRTDPPQLVYDDLCVIAKRQEDYFKHLGSDNFIKLVFYIYSIKNTNDFALGDKMINSLSFIQLIETEGNHTVKTCESCGGDGEYECDDCDGNGYINCDRCDGDGKIDCRSCDGDGREMGDGEWEDCEDCEGSGEESCPDCDGEGTVTCDSCSGGQISCDYCDGNGDIESDTDYDYTYRSIVTWSRQISDPCELKEKQNEPAMSEYDFDRLRDEYITLHIHEDSEPLDILENEMYCIFITTEPELRFRDSNKSMTVDMSRFSRLQDHLLA
jgi:hypothetical protein